MIIYLYNAVTLIWPILSILPCNFTTEIALIDDDEMNPDSAYKYTCGSCKVKVEATQQMFISEPPKVISIHLKRFDIVGQKIGKPIHLSQILDINPFLHDKKNKCENYELCSFITHRGATSDSGHYVAICKEINGSFYEFNDNWVRPMPLVKVLQKTDSYILF